MLGYIFPNLLESLIVVAYVDSVMSTSGRHLSIHAALNTYTEDRFYDKCLKLILLL